MKEPTLQQTLIDEKHNVTIRIKAYRKLTPQAVFDTISDFKARTRKQRKTPLKNKTITIETVIGAED